MQEENIFRDIMPKPQAPKPDPMLLHRLRLEAALKRVEALEVEAKGAASTLRVALAELPDPIQ